MKDHLALASVIEAAVEMEDVNPRWGENNIRSVHTMRLLEVAKNFGDMVVAYQACLACTIERDQLYLDHPSGNYGNTREFLAAAGIKGSKLSDLCSISRISMWCEDRNIPVDEYIEPRSWSKLAEGIPHMNRCVGDNDEAGIHNLLADIDEANRNNASRASIRETYRKRRSPLAPVHGAVVPEEDRFTIVLTGENDAATLKKLVVVLSNWVTFDLPVSVLAPDYDDQPYQQLVVSQPFELPDST